MLKVAIALASLIIITGCEKTELPPKRPASVPESAVWAGGLDGGHWFVCTATQDGQSYACQIYNDFTGTVEAKGTFFFRSVTWSDTEQRATYSEVTDPPAINYDYYDGRIIHLRGGFALVPHGTVDHPFDDTTGKTQAYNMGVEMGEEQEYGISR